MKKHQKDLKLNRDKVKLLSGTGGLMNMSFRDMQRRAVILGMPFEEVPNSDYHKLNSFITKSENKADPTLIDKYDEWMQKELEKAGYDGSSCLRDRRLGLGWLGETNPETGKQRIKRIKGIEKPKKPKREKDSNGLWAGTKKSYTFELAAKGLPIERIIRRVTKKFPEANPKSINQWFKKYHKTHKNEQ